MENKRNNKFNVVMLFERDGNVFRNTKNLYYNNFTDALNAYANIWCPASQLITESTKELMKQKIEEMKRNLGNEEYLKEYIYPFL